MSTRLKTRSDYHEGFNHYPGAGFQGLNRWMKPFFWLALGIVLGMAYNKKDLHACYNLLAEAETVQKTTVADASGIQGNSKEALSSSV